MLFEQGIEIIEEKLPGTVKGTITGTFDGSVESMQFDTDVYPVKYWIKYDGSEPIEISEEKLDELIRISRAVVRTIFDSYRNNLQ